MHIKKFISAFVSILITCGAFNSVEINAVSEEKENFRLIWSDEFDGESLDMNKWSYELGNWKLDENGNYITNGWGNNEQQFYTDKNVTVNDGVLTISARHENYSDEIQGNFEYTSSRLSTQYKFSTCGGRIEVRSRCDSGKSLWPAIWMLPEDSLYGGWAASGEIDIMEGWGSTPEKICGTIHFGDLWPNNTYLTNDYFFENSDSTENWHTYAIEWDENYIRWYVDDVLYSEQNEWYSANRKSPAPFDQNFYLILNLAVGGHFDGVNGIYGDSSIFENGEKQFQIDYIRVYKNTQSDFAPSEIKSAALKPYIESSAASLKNMDGYTEFTIENVGSLEYGIMGLIPAQKVKSGERYRLSFGISSTMEREAIVTVEDQAYNRYLDKKIQLTKEIQFLSYDVNFEKDMSADIKFHLGNIGNSSDIGLHTVIVSDIKWEKIRDDSLGDVNGDGIVSSADLVLLSRRLLGNAVTVIYKNSDLYDDDRLDVYDLIKLRELVINKNN